MLAINNAGLLRRLTFAANSAVQLAPRTRDSSSSCGLSLGLCMSFSFQGPFGNACDETPA
jgi:hypothetical protein